MRILFISGELIAARLALVLKAEGNVVKMYIEENALRDCYDGLVDKVSDWRAELDWVGKDGMIVFDDVGYGKEQDMLRQAGYRVVGGSEMGDRLENDRKYGQRVLQEYGVETLPSHNFSTAAEALEFVKAHPEDLWVLKKNGGHVSHFCYVPESESNNEDVIGILEQSVRFGLREINLQKKVTGVEIGVGRYFNGADWVGPIEMNVEHKSLFPNNLGPKTPEMGTLIWYEDNEQNRLFQSTLAKLKEYLKGIDFRGDIDLSCFVSEQHVWPLEFTARFGSPATALQIELHDSPWTEFLSAVADGKPYNLDYKREVGIVVTLAVPPFPYDFDQASTENLSSGFPVLFSSKVTDEDMKHYHFEEMKRQEGRAGYVVAGAKGCVMHVGAVGTSISEARNHVYERIRKVTVPKAFYREDIGESFEKKDLDLLKEWGWIS